MYVKYEIEKAATYSVDVGLKLEVSRVRTQASPRLHVIFEQPLASSLECTCILPTSGATESKLVMKGI